MAIKVKTCEKCNSNVNMLLRIPISIFVHRHFKKSRAYLVQRNYIQILGDSISLEIFLYGLFVFSGLENIEITPMVYFVCNSREDSHWVEPHGFFSLFLWQLYYASNAMGKFIHISFSVNQTSSITKSCVLDSCRIHYGMLFELFLRF